jgi:hypothetical protein
MSAQSHREFAQDGEVFPVTRARVEDESVSAAQPFK